MENETEKVTATLTINRNYFLIPLEQTLIECSNAVFTGLSILEKLKEQPEFIHGEDDFKMHKPFGGEMTVEQQEKL